MRSETEVLRRTVLAQTDASVFVLDLARVNTIDAGGLGLMLELRQQTQSRGIEFRLKNVTKLVRQVLEITRLDSVFEMTAVSELPKANLASQHWIFAASAACGWNGSEWAMNTRATVRILN